MINAIALLMMAATSANLQDEQPEQDTYYNISRDADALELLALDTLAGPPSATTMIVINLSRSGDNKGVMNTWRINCPAMSMKIVESARFAPGQSEKRHAVLGSLVNPASSVSASTIFKLACRGQGQLVKSRVYHSRLDQILLDFWNP